MPGHDDVQSACKRASAAFDELSRASPESRAATLVAMAAALDARRDEILRVCFDETALTIEELTPEFARMTGTLRMFSDAVREGSWVRAAIDAKWHGHPAHASSRTPHAPEQPAARVPAPQPIGPNHDIRKMLVPLGPVAVFGSSNFPLAYGVCGGDTASAMAAGCPVIVKEHPAHPRTGRLLAGIAQETLAKLDSASTLQYLHNENSADFSIAQRLVQHWDIAAVGFTGSTTGGMALQTLCSARRRPIPVFAEMGSLNCVFVRPRAFARRAEAIADELAASVLARVGQQCTKPGVVFIADNNDHWNLHKMMCERLLRAPARRLLARTVAENYYRRLDEVAESRGILETTSLPTPEQQTALLGVPCVIAAGDIAMEDAPEVWEEIFGPAIIIARCHGSAPSFMPGALTVSIYADPDDTDGSWINHDVGGWGEFAEWLPRVRSKGGRIIFNGPPTGVRVAHGMVHGGPFPATNRPDTTAVGPYAIERWCRPVCFQNCPEALLPPELQNANPRGIWRMVNGATTRSPIG